MPRFTFTADYDFSPAKFKGTVTTAYRAGTTKVVKQECADAATAAGAGAELRPDPKEPSIGQTDRGR